MTRRCLWVMFVLGGLWGVPADAQECDTNCRAGYADPVVVLTDTIPNTTSYRLLMNGAAVALTPVIVNGRVEFSFQQGVQVAGTHIFTIAGAVSVSNTLTVEPLPVPVPPQPPLSPCVTDPLTFSVTRWPVSSTGSRRLDYRTDRPTTIGLNLLQSPWTATATDARGCAVTVRR